MAIAHVQDLPVSSTASSSSFQSSAFGSSVTSGNTILVMSVVWLGSAVSTTSVTDTAGNTYVQDAATNFSIGRANISVWRASNVTGGAAFKVTVNASAASGIVIMAMEVSGLDNSSPLDGAGSTNFNAGATDTSLSTGAFSTTNAADLLVAVYGIDATQASITPNTGWTSAGTLLSAAVEAGEFDYKIVSATQTNVNPTATVPTATRYGAVGLAYKAAAAGGAVSHLLGTLGVGA